MKLIITFIEFWLTRSAKSAANLRREISKVAPKRKPREMVK